MIHRIGSLWTRVRSLSPLALLAALLVPESPAVAVELIRVGGEFQVNAYTPGYQAFPAVAVSSTGDFVVVWSSVAQDGANYGVFGRRFSSAGVALGADFQVNSYTPGEQRYPAAAAIADGEFVVAWTSYFQDGSQKGVFARHFSAAGTGLDVEFQVNLYTTGFQSNASVAAAASGSFVIAWESIGQDGDGNGAFARQFARSGSPIGGELQVSVATLGHQNRPAVAVAGNGDFVVAFDDFQTGGPAFEEVRARRFSSAGNAIGSDFQVNTTTTTGDRFAVVAARPGGDFVVIWESDHDGGGLGGGIGIFGQRFSSSGVMLGGEFQVNTYTPANQRYASVAASGDGDFVVTWLSYYQDGSGGGVFARVFSAVDGAPGAEVQVNTYTPNYQSFPAVAARPNGGDFVLAWFSETQDGGGAGIFAQRLGSTSVLDIDGNGAVTALTDGLLVLRFLFGFTGPTLTTGAVANDCVRCSATAIADYLETLM